MFKKLAVIVAASSMLLATTAAQAGSASALSLRNAPAAEARTSTAAQKESKLVGTPLFAIIGIVAVVALLEVTGVINIFGDDEPDSP
ncbi:hypothetical protein [Sphingomonas psychrotolerans]|uniref:Ferrochelatase n=1 Tax=Sphingomonas psychrotolerans TaxID=1327635 RepID=A0A2K8MDJ6_9SPHN|nr:hypothetical protein [Sphingomonas psychrotolerans]ATY31965.1 hypothetical protein CVN68_08260 [Sphingomonas psychrotolerans]